MDWINLKTFKLRLQNRFYLFIWRKLFKLSILVAAKNQNFWTKKFPFLLKNFDQKWFSFSFIMRPVVQSRLIQYKPGINQTYEKDFFLQQKTLTNQKLLKTQFMCTKWVRKFLYSVLRVLQRNSFVSANSMTRCLDFVQYLTTLTTFWPIAVKLSQRRIKI